MIRAPHRTAAIEGASSAAAQALLHAAVARWRGAGLRVVGLVEEAHGLPERTCSAGFLRDIASGRRYAIYLATPPRETSCHIDAAGAQRAGAAVIPQVPASDLVVLSKFGKLEAAGGGLRPAFEAAVAAGKPVVTAVSSLHRAAWRTFAPEAAALPATLVALEDWWTACGQ
jgi:hypothetical protein